MLDNLSNVVSIAANLLTICTSAIALYIFIFKREPIKKVITILLNYSFQITLSELKSKTDRLSELSARNEDDREEIIDLLNDIHGQIRGNKKLKEQCQSLISSLELSLKYPKKFDEPRKRSLVSEMREQFRGISVDSFEQLMGSDT